MKTGLRIILFILGWIWSSFSAAQEYEPEVIHQAEGVVWGFDFLSDTEMVYTLREGKAGILNLKTGKVRPLSPVPQVYSEGQGGLLDIRVKSIKGKIFVYFSYAEKVKGGATTSVARGEYRDGKIHNLKRIFQAQAVSSKDIHFGSRVEFKDDTYMFVSVGDRGERELAQSLKHHNGKILRLLLDGSVPKDNPFVGKEGTLGEIWSYGHRNPQGLALDSETGTLWEAEFGPRGGDEINIIEPGNNYGWPVITYGREYWGPKIGPTHKEGMEQPVVHYTPSISPSGLGLYTGEKFKAWQGDLFLANLSSQHLRRVEIQNQKVVGQQEYFKDKGWRFRSVRAGPQGDLYFSTDSGRIGRIKTKSVSK